MDIEDQKCELGDILTKLDDTLRKLKQGFELVGNSEQLEQIGENEDGFYYSDRNL